MDKERPRRASFNANVNTARINNTNEGESLFAANNIREKTADNLARAEFAVDEQPLRTEKTEELEQEELEEDEYDNEDDEDNDNEYEIEIDTDDVDEE